MEMKGIIRNRALVHKIRDKIRPRTFLYKENAEGGINPISLIAKILIYSSSELTMNTDP